MPDFYAHIQFAVDGVHRNNHAVNIEALKLGAIFMDVFLYHKVPANKKETMHAAYLLHEESITTFLTNLTNEVKKHYSKEAYAFLLGVLSHYALDAKVNPYILYHSNNKINQRLAFIKGIDLNLMHENHQTDPQKLLVNAILPDFKKMPYHIETLIEAVMNYTYSITGMGKLSRKSYKSMRFMIKHVMQDRTGFKRRVFKLVDRLSGADQIKLASLTHSNAYQDDDYLNFNLKPWKHPVTGIASSDSVLQLMEEAHMFFTLMHEAVDDYIHQDQAVDFVLVFKNLSLNTGVSLAEDQTMRHFKNKVKNQSNL